MKFWDDEIMLDDLALSETAGKWIEVKLKRVTI